MNQTIYRFLLIFSSALSLFTSLHGQGSKDTRMVGLLSFSSNSFQDSIAAKNVYSTVSRVLVQTKRFTILELDKWKLTLDEMNRQKDPAFLDRDILSQGKSLGAQVLVIGTVRNAELLQKDGKYEARVDFDLKFVDVQTAKSIDAQSFKGFSENLADQATRTERRAVRNLVPLINRRNFATVVLTASAFEALSDAQKDAIRGKLIDAIEAAAPHVNAWVRNTFKFDLLFLHNEDVDSHGVVQSMVIEGGEDISMLKGTKLRMIEVTDINTSRGVIQDEKPIAELEVTEVRATTSKCKILKGNKAVAVEADNRNKRIVFDQSAFK